MNHWSRLFRFARPAAKSTRRSASPARGLTLERLEERWAPAIDVTINSDTSVTITDDGVGPISNKIEIVDDLADGNTYLRLNGGVLQRLNSNAGANGKLQNIDIDMGDGNDQVIFTIIAGVAAPNGTNRTIELGAGSDVFTVRGGGDYGGYTFDFDVFDSGGNDRYAVAPSVANGTQKVDVTDDAGNDVYTVTADLVDGYLDLDADDADGFDVYTITSRSLTAASQFFVNVDDDGAGNNKSTVATRVIDASTVGVNLDFSGTSGLNSFGFQGGGTFSNPAVDFTVTGGAGRDSLTFDDGFVESTEVQLTAALGDGDDSVRLVLDGVRGLATANLFDGGELGLDFDLGDGNDVFTATFARTFSIDADNDGITGLTLAVEGGEGDDRITVAAASRARLNLFNDDSYIDVTLNGGEGNDSITVRVPTLRMEGASNVLASLAIDAGNGVDRVALSGVLLDSTGATVDLEVTLGSGDETDLFTSNLISQKDATLAPTYGSVFVDLGFEDQYVIKGLIFGDSLVDVLNFS